MADKDSSSSLSNLSDILAGLTSNPELMEKISGIVGGASTPQDTTSSQPNANIGDVLANPDLMAKLPEVMAVLRPMLNNQPEKASPPKNSTSDAAGRRIALLCALKPYLSHRRCEAIDYFTRMSKMGDLIKNIKF